MFFLLFNFIVCLILAYIIYLGSPKENEIKDKLYFVYAIILLVFFHSFIDPDSVPDVHIYKNVFDRLSSKTPIIGAFFDEDDSEYGENFEVGYKVFLSIVGQIWQNINFFLFINSVVLCFLYLKFFRKYSPLFGISVLLFILLPFNQSLFVLRQHLSLAILLLSYRYIIEQRFWCFLLVVITAILIHTSSVVFIPVYFLYKIKKKNTLFILLLVGLLMSLAVKYVLSFAAIILANSERYSGYGDDASDFIGISTKGFIMLVVLLCYCWTLRERIWEDGINRLVFVISLWGTLFNLVIGELGVGRLFLSYYFVLLIQIPIIIVNIENKVIKSLFVFSVILSFAIFSYSLSADIKSLEGFSLMF